jgi:hypothetical protein
LFEDGEKPLVAALDKVRANWGDCGDVKAVVEVEVVPMDLVMKVVIR